MIEDEPVRKSGDVQTGSGNCAVMLWYCRKIQSIVPSATFYCDGDDTLMFVPPSQEAAAARAAEAIAGSLCMTVKLENRQEG